MKPSITHNKETRTIDVTPSWSGILNTLLLLYTEGNADGRKAALSELQRMAEIADVYVASKKT